MVYIVLFLDGLQRLLHNCAMREAAEPANWWTKKMLCWMCPSNYVSECLLMSLSWNLLIQYANLFVHVQMCLCRPMQTEAYATICAEDFVPSHLFGAWYSICLQMYCTVHVRVFADDAANVMNCACQVNAFSLHTLQSNTPNITLAKFKEGQIGGKKTMTIFFSFCHFILFSFVRTHTHTHAGAHSEVEAKRLTLKVGLLISWISSRSKRTIKGGVCGSEGSLASQHMDVAMKKRAAEGVSLRSTTVLMLGHMQADWPSGDSVCVRCAGAFLCQSEQPALRRHGCASSYGYGYRHKTYTHTQICRT